jgi:regulator of cell morphogenesis and NO signaling
MLDIRYQTLEGLIVKNHKVGLVLHKQGLLIHGCEHQTLTAFCDLMGIDLQETAAMILPLLKETNAPPEPNLTAFSVIQLIHYLEQTHHDYIRIKIPSLVSYLFYLKSIHPEHDFDVLLRAFQTFNTDLKTHILYEEDTVFPYIKTLILMAQEPFFPPKLFTKYKDISIHKIKSAHNHEEEDEMAEIRALTQGFQTESALSLSHKVFIFELKDLERDLRHHAYIEDHHLFPQAEMLERYFSRKMRLVSSLN